MSEKILRVLVVDDHRDGADMLGLIVEELGHQVQVTYGGLPALDVAAAFRPNLVFVDLMMPGMNGFDLVKRLRERRAVVDGQIVAITGQKSDEYKALALQAGCNRVFIKPVALNAVQTALSDLMPAVIPAASLPTRPLSGSLWRGNRMA